MDKAYSFGAPGRTAIVGDWNMTGNTNIGVTNGQQWYLDGTGMESGMVLIRYIHSEHPDGLLSLVTGTETEKVPK